MQLSFLLPQYEDSSVQIRSGLGAFWLALVRAGYRVGGLGVNEVGFPTPVRDGGLLGSQAE